MYRDYDPIRALLSYYRPLHKLGHSLDIVEPSDDLAKYKLVVAPGLNVLTQEEADHLIRFVKAGGHLVLGQRSAMKDTDNARWPQRQPGPLAELLGGAVEQFYAIKSPIPVAGTWGTGKAEGYVEQLTAIAPDVKVLMRYGKSDGWLDGQPAAITRRVDRGSITYIGAALDDAALREAAEWMLKESAVEPELPAVPEGVEVYRRAGAGKNVFIFENFSGHVETIHLPHAMSNVLDGGRAQDVALEQYGVAVMEEQTSGNSGPL
jgi:beta-galactosidase